HTFRRKGHAEHDNQSYVKPGELEEWAAKNDPLDRNIKTLTTDYGFALDQLTAIDAKVAAEVDAATDEAEKSPPPEARDALNGVYADPPVVPTLWYREGIDKVVDKHERAQGWGTYNG
ncbi:MAG: thiamine pyrophosphate-dependent enzyme, partial [Gemmatimonadota bacterium]